MHAIEFNEASDTLNVDPHTALAHLSAMLDELLDVGDACLGLRCMVSLPSR